MLRTAAVLSIAIFVATAMESRAAIPAGQLERIKAATVLIKVTSFSGPGTGSGFLLRQDDGVGYVVTNAHVVQQQRRPARRIECIFHSGASNEFSVSPSIAGIDTDRDLAILQLRHEKLPAPIEINPQVKVRETLSVFILGFPFGEALSTSRRNPAMTISTGNISSIRRDNYGNLALIQIDGGIDPGNSGGPIVTENGQLVGIAVARVRGSRIGMAIPAKELEEMLLGRVRAVTASPIGRSRDRTEFDVSVQLIDPLKQVRSVAILIISTSRVGQKAKAGKGGLWRPISSRMKSSSLAIEEGTAKGKLSLKIDDGKPTDYLLQVKCVRGDGVVRFTSPVKLTARLDASRVPNKVTRRGPPGTTSRAAQSDPEPLDDLLGKPVQPLGDAGIRPYEMPSDAVTVSLPGEISNVLIGGGGRYVILQMEELAKIVVFDVNRAEIVKEMPVSVGALAAAYLDGLVIVLPFDNTIEFRSFDDLDNARRKKIPYDGVVKAIAAGHGSRGPLLVHWAQATDALAPAYFSFLEIPSAEPVELQKVLQLRRPNVTQQRPGRWGEFTLTHYSCYRDKVQIRASAAGNAFGYWATHRSPGGIGITVLDDEEVVSVYEHDSVGHVAPTANGTAVCTGSGYVSANLIRKRNADLCIPSTHPKYYVNLAKRVVVDATTGLVAEELPRLDDSTTARKNKYAQSFGKGLSPDQRYLLVPQAKLFITVMDDYRHLILRQIELDVPKIDKIDSPSAEEGDGGVLVRNRPIPRRGTATPDEPKSMVESAVPKPSESEFESLDLGIVATKLPQDTVQLALPGKIDNVVVAGGGRYLLLHLSERGKLAVFDANCAELVGMLPLADGALLAASLHEFVVVSPFDNTIERWSLGPFERIKKSQLPFPGVITSIALGNASDGPLLLLWAEDLQSRANFSFLNLESLKPVKLRSVTKASGGYPTRVDRPGRWGEFQFSHFVQFAKNPPQIRASADGRLFGLWRTQSSPMGLCTLALDKSSVNAVYQHSSAGHVAPIANGSAVCTGGGFYSSDLVRKRTENICFPTTHARYFLSFRLPENTGYARARPLPQRGSVLDTQAGTPVLRLPELTEMQGVHERQFGEKNLTLDQRYLCIPQARLMVTIPLSSDHLVLREVDLEIPKPEPAMSRNLERSPVRLKPHGLRTWTDKTGKFSARARLVSAARDHVRLKKGNGRLITVPLSKLSRADIEFLRSSREE